MDSFSINRFVSNDLQFEGDGIEMNANKPKRNLNDYLKTGTEVELKTEKGTVKIKGLWQLNDGIIYDYLGSSIDQNDNIYFNNDDISNVHDKDNNDRSR